MSKYIKFMAFAMMAVFSLVFVSCSDDDDDEPSASGSQIEINGVKHYVGGEGIYFIGAYTGTIYSDDDGICTINMHVNDGRPDNGYQFMYLTGHAPRVGDDLSQMKEFTVTPFNFYDKYEEVELAYSSGSAKITAINTSVDDGAVTIRFDNLKMVSGSLSLTFNGTAVIPFNFH
ncbi:MAG: hypothetical protein J6M54_01590 [Prevotella sp.]|nr:hypothetical protein [Prevotella sp.]